MMTTITAHSGCEGTQDDSLESIHKAIALGADIVEVDVRFDKQGELVISHDRREDYSGRFPLGQAFELVVKNPIGINCDIKEAETIPAVLALADKMGLGPEKLAFSGSLSPAFLRENPGITKRAGVYVNVEGILQGLFMKKLPPAEWELLKKMDHWKAAQERAPEIASFAGEIASLCRELGVRALNLPVVLTNEPVFAALRELQVPFSVWTVNEPEKIQKLLEENICNLTTRTVKTAVELKKKIAKR